MNRNGHLSEKTYGKHSNPATILTDSPTKGYRPELDHKMADWVIRKETKKAARRKVS